jgi:hypothetical protein
VRRVDGLPVRTTIAAAIRRLVRCFIYQGGSIAGPWCNRLIFAVNMPLKHRPKDRPTEEVMPNNDPLDLNISAKVMEQIEHYADEILKASGSALRYFTLPAVRRAILLACLELRNEAFTDGIAYHKAMRDAEADRAQG